MVILATVKQTEVSKSLLLQGNQDTGNHLLVFHGVTLQTVGYHIVDVLDEDHIGIDLVQILNQCTMTTGTEQQRSVIVTERGVVGIGSHCVGTGFLLGEGDIVFDTILPCKAVFLLCHFLLKESDVLMTDSEVNVGLAIAGSIECTFHQMLLHRGARSLGIFVEQQHTFGQLTIVQTLGT